MCTNCRALLDVMLWERPGPRLCDRCAASQPAPTIRVYCFFQQRAGWQISFLEADLKTPIGRGLHFADVEKLRELVARTPTRLDSADRNAFEHGILIGRGAVWLELTGAQYRALRR